MQRSAKTCFISGPLPHLPHANAHTRTHLPTGVFLRVDEQDKDNYQQSMSASACVYVCVRESERGLVHIHCYLSTWFQQQHQQHGASRRRSDSSDSLCE